MNLQQIKSRLHDGVCISNSPSVVDIGDGMIVKHGTRVSDVEENAANLVSSFTLIRVPKMIASHSEVLYGRSYTYLVQEKLPGLPLMSFLESLDTASCNDLANQLASIVTQLKRLDRKGIIGHPGYPGCLKQHIFAAFRTPCRATTTQELVDWIAAKGEILTTPADRAKWISTIDFTRPQIFCHGDLVPENILVEQTTNGGLVITGVVDWEATGWYPYFWNDFITRRRLHQYPQQWAKIASCMLMFPNESTAFDYLFNYAEMAAD
ncbi:hypothetical protein Hypma_012131 [Hypsizygus marmoreus]|uniref:Aminoglycoside phosphotransferase domain-containing protein n=1 Tax=Hypsizygus marmoreus TaxID=39966 RepID=A0A369JP56_HYPMA|nr:hypothetical protein Hypma_012131 [Hypsizygus marmoreus]